MTTPTIRIDPKLEKALERIASATGRTKSEIAREALKRHVAVAHFRELRRKTLPFAEAQGLVSEDDVFRALPRSTSSSSRAPSARAPRRRP
jgi:predicted transcriptional regulator